MLIFQAINMEPDRSTMISLFGEDHHDSDEEIIRYQRDMKRRIHDALGSDSESTKSSDILEIEYTDISDNEDDMGSTPQPTKNDKPDQSKHFQETKHMTSQSIRKIEMVRTKEKTIDQKKALAQYRRQMAAKITKCQVQNNIQLHDSIILVNKLGQPVEINEDDIVKDESKIMQEADKTIQSKGIAETIMPFIHYRLDNSKKTLGRAREESVESIQQPVTIAASNKIPVITNTTMSRKERRQRWYQKKVSKSS